MCFGGSSKSSGSKRNSTVIPTETPVISTPTPTPTIDLTIPDPVTTEPQKNVTKKFDWWAPPSTHKPILSLNPLATNQPQSVYDLRNTGRSRLTIPLRGSGIR